MPPLNPMQLSVISDEYYFKGFVLGRDRLYEHMVQTYNINFIYFHIDSNVFFQSYDLAFHVCCLDHL